MSLDDHSTDATDVGVVNLTDRRKIAGLEKQVLDLTAKLSAALGQVKPGLTRERHVECYHGGSFEVSDNTPEVTCNDCGAVMDAYTVLRKIAHREVNFCYTLNGLRAESERLTKDVASLKSKRARLRGAVSKATPDTPLDDVAAAMKAVSADRLEAIHLGGRWCARLFRSRMGVAASPSFGTLREAVASVLEFAAATTKEAQ